MGTSTRAEACALTSKPQSLLLRHSTSAVASTFKSRTHPRYGQHGQKNKIRSFSSVTVSLIEEVTVEKQRSAPGSAVLELQGSGAPGAPAAIKLPTHTSWNEPTTSPFPLNSRNQTACLQRKKPTTHTPWNEQYRNNATTRASVFTPTADPLDSTAREVTQQKHTLTR